MAVTLKDISKRTGLSVPSVCLILNGQGHKFRPASVEAVQLAAKEMRYRPDMVMRRKGQASTRHDAIGVLLQSNAPARIANQPAHELIWGINNQLLDSDQLMVLVQLDADRPGSKPPRLISERFIDGLIVVSTGAPTALIEMVDHFSIPAVWLGTERKATHDCVMIDDRGAGTTATEHLLSLGHRNILFVSAQWQHDASTPAHESVESGRGYADAMTAAGLTPRSADATLASDANLSKLIAFIRESQKSDTPITAVVCASMQSAARLLDTMGAIGVDCPKEISVVSACDLKLFHDAWPQLTRVGCDRTIIGAHAAKMLLDKITSGNPQPSHTFKGGLITGTTTARPA